MPDHHPPAPPAPPAPREPIRSGGALAALVPENIDQAFRIAEGLARAGDMIPKTFQGKPMEIMAAIMRGMEIGLAPMQALSAIAVINGRASLWGDALPALVLRAGHHLDVEMEGEGDTLTAVATLTRSNGKAVVRRFSVADAKRAQLWGKSGPWSQYPQRMLAMRARAWAVRDGAADVLMGLQVAEEVRDYAETEHVGPDRAKDVTRREEPARPVPARGGAVYRDVIVEAPADEIVEHTEPGPDGPSPEELARAEAEARAASEDAWRNAER